MRFVRLGKNATYLDKASGAYNYRKIIDQLCIGRRQRLGLPLLPCHLEESHLQQTDAKNKETTRLHDKTNAHAKELLDLGPGERVWIQHHQTKEWYKQATVVESRHSGRAYELVDDDGKTYYTSSDVCASSTHH